MVLLAILLFGAGTIRAEQRDSLTVSLLTCWPGQEVFELCGHSALRVRNSSGTLDNVYNYGVFDFNAPNFIYRFVKGETDYMLGVYPFDFFMPEYQISGRKVLEQELNLTDAEKERLFQLLQTESQPGNNVYRYNYVLDNCATRITMRLNQALGERINFPDTVAYGTFRNEMRQFHRHYPWYQLGIDICLGSPVDYPLEADYEMFVPIVMAKRYSEAKLPDGRPLVKSQTVLNQGVPDASLPPTPWYLTPLFIAWVVAAGFLILCAVMVRRKKLYRTPFSVWFLLIGIIGCVPTFLWLFSTHYATSPNLLILWLNPLQLVIGAGVWFRKFRPVERVLIWLDILLTGILMIAWPFQTQSANPAFFPMEITTMALAVTYTILDYNKSYINNEKGNKHTVGGHRGTKRAVSTGRRRKTSVSSRNHR